MKNYNEANARFEAVMEEVKTALTDEFVRTSVSDMDNPESLARNIKIMSMIINLFDSITELAEARTNQLDAIQTSLDELKKR